MTCSSTKNRVTERSSARYTTTLVDEAGNPVALAVLTGLTLWLRDVTSEDYINGRESQDVLNTNNVTYHATSGLLTWNVQPEDNVVVSSTDDGDEEEHEAVFQAEWTGGGAKTWVVKIYVTNLPSLE